MFETHIAAGFDPAAFWKLTPRAYHHQMRGANQRAERERQTLAWAVWHVAVLGRVKKVPDFDEFVRPQQPVKSKKARQTRSELEVGLKMLAAAWGARMH